MIPCAPASRARFIIQPSSAGMRTMGEEPAAAMAAMERYIWSSEMLPCSQSISTHCVLGTCVSIYLARDFLNSEIMFVVGVFFLKGMVEREKYVKTSQASNGPRESVAGEFHPLPYTWSPAGLRALEGGAEAGFACGGDDRGLGSGHGGECVIGGM